MKNRNLFIFMMLSPLAFGQVGIGNSTPRGALDINQSTTNTMGLVLPSNASTENIINPQGGTVAEGTIIYDMALKCVKVFNGTSWSNCLCDACSTPAPTVNADCSKPGFQGVYTSGTALSNASFSITVTNNSFSTANISFDANDLVLSGVSGVNVSGVSPATVSLTAGQSQVITYTLAGTPSTGGDLTATWSKLSLSCTQSTPVIRNARFAFWSTYSLGHAYFPDFNSQLKAPENYGPKGTFSGVNGFSFTDITSSLSSLTVKQLLDSYDVISTGYANMSAEDAAKIKGFVDGGGVAIILFDSNVGTTLFNAFGGTGSVGSGVVSATTNTNALNKGVFGDTTNVTLNGEGSYGEVNVSQIPAGATVLATNGNRAQVFVSGAENRALFFWDEGVFRNRAVEGTLIDTPQERFLHNIIIYALRKAGL